MRRMILVLVIAALAAACGADETASEGEPTPAPTNLLGGSSTENKLPEGFPSDLPLPEDRTVVYSQFNQQGSVVYFDSDMDAAALKAFFTEQLPAAGYKIRTCQSLESPAPIVVLITSKDTSVATITLGQLPGATGDFEGDYDFWVAAVESPAAPSPEPEPTTCP